MPNYKKYGSRPWGQAVKLLIEEKGVTVVALSKKLGIGSSTVSNWFGGLSSISKETYRKLCSEIPKIKSIEAAVPFNMSEVSKTPLTKVRKAGAKSLKAPKLPRKINAHANKATAENFVQERAPEQRFFVLCMEMGLDKSEELLGEFKQLQATPSILAMVKHAITAEGR